MAGFRWVGARSQGGTASASIATMIRASAGTMPPARLFAGEKKGQV
jgi:hypothetical protein